MASSQTILMSFRQQQERSPSALTGWRTSCSLISLLKALCNLGMWLIRLHLMLEKYPRINYSGTECKKHSKVKTKFATTCSLWMIIFSLNLVTWTCSK